MHGTPSSVHQHAAKFLSETLHSEAAMKQHVHSHQPPSNLPSLASGLEFLINAENLANISIPAVFDSGCFGESFRYLKSRKE